MSVYFFLSFFMANKMHLLATKPVSPISHFLFNAVHQKKKKSQFGVEALFSFSFVSIIFLLILGLVIESFYSIEIEIHFEINKCSSKRARTIREKHPNYLQTYTTMRKSMQNATEENIFFTLTRSFILVSLRFAEYSLSTSMYDSHRRRFFLCDN